MDEPRVATSPGRLSKRFYRLHQGRKKVHLESRQRGTRRQVLTAVEREEILRKTGARCHICGGEIESRSQADHVLAHSGGGQHAVVARSVRRRG